MNILKYLISITLILPLSIFAEDLISIPVMVGQTGDSATFGEQEMKGYTLAVEEWNAKGGILGKKIVLQVEDTQTKQATIVSTFHRLSLLNPQVILGPTWLDGFRAIIPLAKKREIALVTPSAAVEAFGEYSGWPISFYFNTTVEVKSLLSGIKEKGLGEKIALVYEKEPYAELVRKLLLNEKPNIILDLGIDNGESDFNSMLIRLLAKKPDILIVLVWNERSLLSLFQQLKRLASTVKLATVHDGEGWSKQNIYRSNLRQLIFTKFIVDNKDFVMRFEKRFNVEPLLTASTAYDAANNVFYALSKGAKTATELREFLLNNELNTATFGPIRLNSDGGVSTSQVSLNEYVSE